MGFVRLSQCNSGERENRKHLRAFTINMFEQNHGGETKKEKHLYRAQNIWHRTNISILKLYIENVISHAQSTDDISNIKYHVVVILNTPLQTPNPKYVYEQWDRF